MSGVEHLLPAGFRQGIAPAATVGEVVAEGGVDSGHPGARCAESERQLAVLVDVQGLIEPADLEKGVAGHRLVRSARRRPQHRAVGLTAQRLHLDLVQASGPRARIDARLGAPADGGEVLQNLVARDPHARQFAGRKPADPGLLATPGGRGLGVDKEARAAQMQNLAPPDQARGGGVALDMPPGQIRSSQGVAVQKEQEVAGGRPRAGIGGGRAPLGGGVAHDDQRQAWRRLGQDGLRVIGRAVVDHHHLDRGRLPGQRGQGEPQPIGLVAAADDHAQAHGASSAAWKRPRSSSTRTTSAATSRQPSALR